MKTTRTFPVYTKLDNGWIAGAIGPYRFEIKAYDTPSVWGINEGCISKLHLALKDSHETVAAYDRGWDKFPESVKALEAVDALCALWN